MNEPAATPPASPPMNRRTLLAAASTLPLVGCSTSQVVVSVATARDPETALRNMAHRRVKAYTCKPQLALADLRRLQAEMKNGGRGPRFPSASPAAPQSMRSFCEPLPCFLGSVSVSTPLS